MNDDKGHDTTMDTMSTTLKAMAMDLAQTLTQIKSFRYDFYFNKSSEELFFQTCRDRRLKVRVVSYRTKISNWMNRSFDSC